jgi:four helix bundle protein
VAQGDRHCCRSVPNYRTTAAGCGRGTDPAFIQFLEYAIGSVFEIETQLEVVERLKLVSVDDLKKLKSMIDEEGKMINGLISSLQ